jgi:hypothetical protein
MNKTNYLGAGLIKVKDELGIYIAGGIISLLLGYAINNYTNNYFMSKINQNLESKNIPSFILDYDFIPEGQYIRQMEPDNPFDTGATDITNPNTGSTIKKRIHLKERAFVIIAVNARGYYRSNPKSSQKKQEIGLVTSLIKVKEIDTVYDSEPFPVGWNIRPGKEIVVSSWVFFLRALEPGEYSINAAGYFCGNLDNADISLVYVAIRYDPLPFNKILGTLLNRNKSRVNGRSFPGTINTRLNDTSALNLNLKINKTMDLSQGGLIDDPGNMKRAGSMPGNRREQGSVEKSRDYDNPLKNQKN